MRSIPFWTLVLLSIGVSLLMIYQIYLSRAIIREQHVLVDYHEEADGDKAYTQAWEKLALLAYKASAQDPAMLELLKSENISIHQGPPPSTVPPGAISPPVTMPTSTPASTPTGTH